MANKDEVVEGGIRKKYKLTKREMVKLIIAYWCLGICNNIGYVVALTAAHDLLHKISKDSGDEGKEQFKRECTVMGTGILLLADIVPSIIVKMIAPFCPLMIRIRYIVIISLSAGGFIMIAFGFESMGTSWIGIIGVICISISQGLGESSALAYMAFFPTQNSVSAWSSGTGAAGVVGALMYSLLRHFKVDERISILIMLMWPVIMAVAFFVLLPHPKVEKHKKNLTDIESYTNDQMDDTIPMIDDPHTILVKIKMVRKILFKYTLPYSLTYFFEYFINQALFELLYYPEGFLKGGAQYRWYQVLYQVGVFIGRSSMNLVKINYLYGLAFIQFMNAFILLMEVFFGFLYYLLICLIFVSFEGLVAGVSYVNTYRRISSEVPPLQREFSMAINSLSDSIAITLAGLVSIPVHGAICKTASPYVKKSELSRMMAAIIQRT